MKHLTIALIIGIFLCSGSVVFAAKGGQKGPSERAYERANENAAFKRDKDWAPGDHDKKSDKDHDGDKNKHGHKKHKKNKHKHHDDADHEHEHDKKDGDDSEQDENSSDTELTNETK